MNYLGIQERNDIDRVAPSIETRAAEEHPPIKRVIIAGTCA